ncbi:MAG: efflux RND transporter periplasmic adaptor subunit [Rhodanobacter sp.]
MKSSFPRTTALCLGLLVLAACGKSADPNAAKAPPPPEVGVLQVQPVNAPLTQDLVGRLSPYRSADVRARVPGVLLKRSYDEGSNVKKGQLLFQIDPAPFKATLNASLAALAQAQATYTNNKITAQRVRDLVAKGYVSKADMDNASAAERTSAAAVQAARANVESARINLGYANVTSPINGRAGQQQVTEGALVGSGEATLLTTVDQIDPLYVNFTMSVSQMEKMRQAQSAGNLTLASPNTASVQIALPDGSDYANAGTLDFSDTTVNPATGSVNLRALIPNPKHRLLPGMYVTLKANMGEQHHVFLIPQQALQRDTTGAYVMTVGSDSKVLRKDVTVGTMQGTDWVINGGLNAGDKVVVSGLQGAKAGAPAKATPWHKPAAATASSATTPGSAPSSK